jgi:predicted transcriptional regulator
VKYILLFAVEATFDDLMRSKKYLFYLIDYDLISYNGQRQTYSIKDKGLEVLSRMIESKIV